MAWPFNLKGKEFVCPIRSYCFNINSVFSGPCEKTCFFCCFFEKSVKNVGWPLWWQVSVCKWRAFSFWTQVDWCQPFKLYSVGVIHIVLVGLIPGPKEPKIHMNPFLEHIVVELEELWNVLWLPLWIKVCFWMCLLILWHDLVFWMHYQYPRQ